LEHIRNEWLVFFYSPYNPPWYTKWRKKGFIHCGAMYFNKQFDCWVVVEGLYGQLLIELIDEEEAIKMLSFIKRLNGTILKGKEQLNHNFRGEWWVKEHSCVSYIQRMIGLRNFWLFTPYQLFCALRKIDFEFFVDARINNGQKTKTKTKA